MYISAQHINVKLNQDYSCFNFTEQNKSLILCDGIGEFSNSSIVAKKVCEIMIEKAYANINQLIQDEEIINLKTNVVDGGTTILFANTTKNNTIVIEHLGNGGCIQLGGAFADTQNELLPYRYNHLINPHISSRGALTRHLSHNSGKNELISGKITLTLNNYLGDIIIFFTDGINSLEENIIIKDNEGRFWRNESNAIQFIITSLNEFLLNQKELTNFQDKLISFNIQVLIDLKNENLLEDDASLAFVITEETLKHYQNKND
jgi:hypothetical protein